MFPPSSSALGTMMVSQLRVSTTVWRQRMRLTCPAAAVELTQSPTWMELSS